MENDDNLFSFLMVMISIIIGFGVTELLGGSARLLRARKEAKPYWLHTVAVIGVFMAHLVLWWEAWGLRLIQDWTFPGALFMLATPIGLYLIASLIFPDDVKGCDFREYYFENFRLIWIIAIIVTVLATSFRPVMFGHSIIDLDNLPSLIQIMISIAIFSTKNPIIHTILVPLFFLIVVSDQLIFRYSIVHF